MVSKGKGVCATVKLAQWSRSEGDGHRHTACRANVTVCGAEQDAQETDRQTSLLLMQHYPLLTARGRAGPSVLYLLLFPGMSTPGLHGKTRGPQPWEGTSR